LQLRRACCIHVYFSLDVYEKVKEKYENCCLVYVGSGPLLEEVHDYSSKKHLKDIHFIDRIPQNELPSLYTESSLFILPTRYEIFGMVIMEAMYFGHKNIESIAYIFLDNFHTYPAIIQILFHVFLQ